MLQYTLDYPALVGHVCHHGGHVVGHTATDQCGTKDDCQVTDFHLQTFDVTHEEHSRITST